MSGEAVTGETTPPPPSKVMTPTEIVLALATRNLGALVGAKETDQVDFKGARYDLGRNGDKQDLIADVASLANARGGVIVMGVTTVKHSQERVEVADKVPGYPLGTALPLASSLE